jgi:hypothetical protein
MDSQAVWQMLFGLASPVCLVVVRETGAIADGRARRLILSLATRAIHLVFNAGYGLLRDELYFIVCGDRPAWGYVDQPPLIPILASWFTRRRRN